MKFEEALMHLREGKKIRLSYWGKLQFIHTTDSSWLVDEDYKDHTLSSSDIFEDDWELYEENEQKYSKPEIGLFGCDIKNKVFNSLLRYRDERLGGLEERIRLLEKK